VTETPVQQDVIDILTTDHHEVIDLLQQIKISTDAEERRDLADTVISELVRHSVAEEMYVYPAMKKYLPDGDQAVDHDVEEHKELEKAMKNSSRSMPRVLTSLSCSRIWRTSCVIMFAMRRTSSSHSCVHWCHRRN
jgi:hemerythrin superfamily protein